MVRTVRVKNCSTCRYSSVCNRFSAESICDDYESREVVYQAIESASNLPYCKDCKLIYCKDCKHSTGNTCELRIGDDMFTVTTAHLCDDFEKREEPQEHSTVTKSGRSETAIVYKIADSYVCSKCGEAHMCVTRDRLRYCHHCGAKFSSGTMIPTEGAKSHDL